MGLIEALQVKPKVAGCPIARLMVTLIEAEKLALADAFNNPDVKATVIETALRQEGHKTSHNTVYAHKNKKCGCYWEVK